MTSATHGTSVVSSRYATALIDLTESGKKTPKIEEDLKAVQTLLEECAEFRTLVTSPLFSREEQAKAVQAVADKAGFDKIVKNFLGVLVENRRLSALEPITRAALKEIASRRGEISATVRTVRALSARQQKDLQDKLSKSMGADVLLENRVDPGIMGGMVLTVGSRMIDDSVRRKLERLSSAMRRQANQNGSTNLKEVG